MDSSLSFAQGQSDGANAASLAGQAGFGSGAIIFLDVENGGTLSDAMIQYIQGWVSEINSSATIYYAGVYCSYDSASQISSAVSGYGGATFWCFNVNCPTSPGCAVPIPAPNPSDCGYSSAVIWQYAQSPEPSGTGCSNYTGGQCPQQFGGYSLNVDLDTATTTNPSNG